MFHDLSRCARNLRRCRLMRRVFLSARLGVPLVLIFGLGACTSTPSPDPDHEALLPSVTLAEVSDSDHLIRIDGELHDWPRDRIALADAQFVYLRFNPGDPLDTLQANDETLVVLLDMDGSVLSGSRDEPWGEGLGVDLEIQFSPLDAERGTPRSGVSLALVDARGRRTPISHADADFLFSPTVASDWYEMRVSRQIPLMPGWRAGVQADAVRPLHGDASSTSRERPTGPYGAGVIFMLDGQGRQIGSLPAFRFALPAPAPEHTPAPIAPPARRMDAIRVMSMNVLRSSPLRNPDPFVRMIRAMNPDVVLFQEFDADPAEVTRWLGEHLGEDWRADGFGEHGVLIASRGPITPLLDEAIRVEGEGRPVRAFAARVRTPIRDSVVVSVHLKCCGSARGEEEARRQREARAINAALVRAAVVDPQVRVIAGDLNLVGTRAPLDLLRRGLDLDGSDLAVAPAMVVDDAASYTWRDAASPFSPGRLDWIVYSDSSADLASAFVLDTTRLAPEVLATLGLEREDSLASDHLPVIVDLRPR